MAIKDVGHAYRSDVSEKRHLVAIDRFLWKHLDPSRGSTALPLELPPESKKHIPGLRVRRMVLGRMLLSHDPLTLRARKCLGFLERAQGLLFRHRLKQDEAIFISPCRAIHTFGMTYAIDVAFVDDTGVVLQVSANVRPFGAASCRKATAAWEFAGGACKNFGIEPGVRLSFVPHD